MCIRTQTTQMHLKLFHPNKATHIPADTCTWTCRQHLQAILASPSLGQQFHALFLRKGLHQLSQAGLRSFCPCMVSWPRQPSLAYWTRACCQHGPPSLAGRLVLLRTVPLPMADLRAWHRILGAARADRGGSFCWHAEHGHEWHAFAATGGQEAARATHRGPLPTSCAWGSCTDAGFLQVHT